MAAMNEVICFNRIDGDAEEMLTKILEKKKDIMDDIVKGLALVVDDYVNEHKYEMTVE